MKNTKLVNYIEKAKRNLQQQLKINGYFENIGQPEIREARSLIDYENYSADCQAVKEFERFVDSL